MAIFNEGFIKKHFAKYDALSKDDCKKCQDIAEGIVKADKKISDCYKKTNLSEEYKLYKSAKSSRWPIPLIQIYPYNAHAVSYNNNKDIMDDAKVICDKIQQKVGDNFIISPSGFADNSFYQILVKSNKVSK